MEHADKGRRDFAHTPEHTPFPLGDVLTIGCMVEVVMEAPLRPILYW